MVFDRIDSLTPGTLAGPGRAFNADFLVGPAASGQSAVALIKTRANNWRGEN